MSPVGFKPWRRIHTEFAEWEAGESSIFGRKRKYAVSHENYITNASNAVTE
jgi:hypothetical protein